MRKIANWLLKRIIKKPLLAAPVVSGSLQFNELYKLLDDKRMKQHIDITSSYWHLYRKQTAEYLLDNFDLVPKQ